MSQSVSNSRSKPLFLNINNTQRTIIAILLLVQVIDAIIVRSSSILAPFIRTELGIDNNHFRTHNFIYLCITHGLFVLSETNDSFITLYLVDEAKLSALIAGTLFGVIQLTGIGGRIFWGLLADRYFSHNRWILLSGLPWLMGLH